MYACEMCVCAQCCCILDTHVATSHNPSQDSPQHYLLWDIHTDTNNTASASTPHRHATLLVMVWCCEPMMGCVCTIECVLGDRNALLLLCAIIAARMLLSLPPTSFCPFPTRVTLDLQIAPPLRTVYCARLHGLWASPTEHSFFMFQVLISSRY